MEFVSFDGLGGFIGVWGLRVWGFWILDGFGVGVGVWGLGLDLRWGLASQVLLGGSWLGRSRAISRITIVITYIKGLITPLITTHEPPSRG